MKNHRKYAPYIRRATGREKAETIRIAFRLAFYQSLGRPYYVMVQRGFPTLAIEVGASKRDVQSGPALVGAKLMRFSEWASIIQRRATGRKPRKVISRYATFVT